MEPDPTESPSGGEIAKYAGSDLTRWELFRGAVVVHKSFGEGRIDDVTIRDNLPTWIRVLFGTTPKFFNAESFATGALSFTRVPDSLASACARWKIEWADEQKRRAEKEAQRVDQLRAAQARELEMLETRRLEAEELALMEAAAVESKQQDRRAKYIGSLCQKTSSRQRASMESMQRIIAGRSIKRLVHFTREENLASILEHGILPRKAMKEMPFVANDQARLDGFDEATCVSIEFPNYKMFYRYQCETPSVNWAVIQLPSRLLVEKPCLFFPSNAASSRARRLSQDALIAAEGLQAMFGEHREGLRAELNLLQEYPTDPQAEVLIFDVIEPSCFEAIHFSKENAFVVDIRKKLSANVYLHVGGAMFGPRNDWQYWKSNSVDLVDSQDIPF